MGNGLLSRKATVCQTRIAEIGRTLVTYKREAGGEHGEKKGDDRIIVLWDDAYSGDLKNLVEGFELTVYVDSEEDGQCSGAE